MSGINLLEGDLIALKSPFNDNLLSYCISCWNDSLPPHGKHGVFVHTTERALPLSPWAVWRVYKFANGTFGLQNLQSNSFLYSRGSNQKTTRITVPQIASVGYAPLTTNLQGLVGMTISKFDNKYIRIRSPNNFYLSVCNGCQSGAGFPVSATFHISDAASPFVRWEIIPINKVACCNKMSTPTSSEAICGNMWGNTTVCDGVMNTYCATNKDDPACACINSDIPQPYCNNIKCQNGGYLTQNMLNAQANGCGTFIDCRQFFNLSEDAKQNLVNNNMITQFCGTAGPSPNTGVNNTTSFVPATPSSSVSSSTPSVPSMPLEGGVTTVGASIGGLSFTTILVFVFIFVLLVALVFGLRYYKGQKSRVL